MTEATSASLQPSIDSGPVVDFGLYARLGGGLIDTIEVDDRFESLRCFLMHLCKFQNFLVYLFDQAKPPVLLGTSVPERRLNAQMADFVAGLFLLDPFVLAAHRGVSGLTGLHDIMPEGFFDSEYFHHHYRYTDVCDELRYIVPVGRDRSIHIFVERETPSPVFSPRDRATLSAAAPMVVSFVGAKSRWLDRLPEQNGDLVVAIDLRVQIGVMAKGKLTWRECEVVEWMLKGHSAKSIANILHIEEGTVTNHKRSIYSKLDVHSMAQLFNMFLRSLIH